MDLIVSDPGRYHVSLDTVWEFEEVIHLDPRVRVVSSRDKFLSNVPNLAWRFLFRAMSKLGASPNAAPDLSAQAMNDYFAVLMGPNLRKTMPRFLGRARKSAYFFDAWPRNHRKMQAYADACRVDNFFISSSQGTAMLNTLLKSTRCHWIPEGITPQDYYLAFRPEKDIDVLQLGRRYNSYHGLIAETLEREKKVYLHEKIPGEVIFPTRLDYVEGLARAKISICVPFSLSHPERAGGIETMTMRYLQSMLSRCVIVGHAPAEMTQLFGYNPVIEIDYSDPANQLLQVLKNYADYLPLVERNYRCVREDHTWERRWQQIAKILYPEK